MSPEFIILIRNAIRSGDLGGLIAIFDSQPEAVRLNTVSGSWLHVASSYGHVEIVRALIEDYGLDFNQRGGVANASPLHRAAADGHFQVVEYLLSKGAEMDTSAPERNPLFGAILGGNVEIGKLLIARGIDTAVRYNTDTMQDMSALDFANERGAKDFVRLLEMRV